MSEKDGASDHVDNWVFDSLVNFLHGSIWKVPVVGFIEEKSVVFDPDSYNNMTEEKEEEFRKIHDEYKGLVDFMLTSFMEDLQVTPEQVEEACRAREHQSKTLPESHITKVALEQLWAAEDFTAFRRLMTRKNIDLQLQSLELLVAKYGVLSPALRSGAEDLTGDDGEDDFLQVVIRYSDQLESFKCDYGTNVPSPGLSYRNGEDESSAVTRNNSHSSCLHGGSEEQDDRNMQLHLAGVSFKNKLAPVHYQATLTSSTSAVANPHHAFSCPPLPAQIESQVSLCPSEDADASLLPTNDEEKIDEDSKLEQEEELPEPISLPLDLSTLAPSPIHASPTPTPPPSPSPPNENLDSIAVDDESHIDPEIVQNEFIDKDSDVGIEKDGVPNESEEAESQLIQLEKAEAAIEEESDIDIENAAREAATPSPPPPPPPEDEVEELQQPVPAPLVVSPPLIDEKTAVEIASTAPEQRRLLTAVRKALEINPEETEPSASITIPSSSTVEDDEDLQKRREYLRAQRDKLIAMKKQEREKLLLANTTSGGGSQIARPKSARAAQIALKNPQNMRAASLNEKSLSARRALADRLKQELIEK